VQPATRVRARGVEGEIALCPSSRSAQVYVLDREREAELVRRSERTLLALSAREGRVASAVYPDALGRVWSALRCRTAGELLASARPGYEFLDWGGAHHVGGGSHGALHANDSLGSLIWCGTGPLADSREQWALRDVVPMICEHFGVECLPSSSR